MRNPTASLYTRGPVTRQPRQAGGLPLSTARRAKSSMKSFGLLLLLAAASLLLLLLLRVTLFAPSLSASARLYQAVARREGAAAVPLNSESLPELSVERAAAGGRGGGAPSSAPGGGRGEEAAGGAQWQRQQQ